MTPPVPETSYIDPETAQQTPVAKVKVDIEQSSEQNGVSKFAPQQAPSTSPHQTTPIRAKPQQLDVQNAPRSEKHLTTNNTTRQQSGKQIFREQMRAYEVSADIRRRAFMAATDVTNANEGTVISPANPRSSPLKNKRPFTSIENNEEVNISAVDLPSENVHQRKKLRLEAPNLESHQMLRDKPLSIRSGPQQQQSLPVVTGAQDPKQAENQTKVLRDRMVRNIVLTKCRKDLKAAWEEAFNAGDFQRVSMSTFVKTIRDLLKMIKFLQLNEHIDSKSYDLILVTLKPLLPTLPSQLPSVELMNDLYEVLCNAGATVNNHATPVMLDQWWHNFETAAVNLVIPSSAPENVDLLKKNIKETRDNIETLVYISQTMGVEAWLDNRETIEPQQRAKELRQYDSVTRNFMRSSAKCAQTILEKQLKSLTNDASDKAQLQLVLAQLQEIIVYMTILKVGDTKSVPDIKLRSSSPRAEQSAVPRGRDGSDVN